MSAGVSAAYDHHSREYAERHLEIHRELRRTCPVAHTDAHGGYWVVSRYADVAEVARDDVTYSSAWRPEDGFGGVTIPPARSLHIPIEVDPPAFLKYRRILNSRFSPAEVDRWRSRIEAWASLCIDQVIETGTIDIVADLSNPLPALFTCELLGLPVGDWARYARPYHEMIFTPPGPERDALAREVHWIYGSLAELVAKRRAEPADDLITYLTRAEIEGERLTDDEIVSICDLVMAGGFDTTTAATASALGYLHQNPADRQRLVDDPGLLPTAVEEFLRYFSPTQGLARTVTVDTTLAGQSLAAGDRLLISWASANHDETVFDRPD
ncbi:MAG: hypothetical protein QOG64_295, partial [Acidimicrobiaceae bacterium]|nr:hypothetical protein [Acidimicrobiaceae bacterium]